MSRRRDLSGNVKSKSFSSMQKNMTESETSDEELSISSDPRRDSAEVKISNDPSLRDHGIQRQQSKQQQQSNGSEAAAKRKGKKKATDEEIAQRYSNALEEEQKNKRARRVVVPPLSSTQLITGLVKTMHDFPTSLTAQCHKGKEAAYTANLIKAYKAFCHDLAPNASFLDTIAKIDSLGGKKDVKLCLQQMRDQHRDSVLDRILGQTTRERILKEKNGSRNDEDGKTTVDSHSMNDEGEKDDDGENEANLADVVDASQGVNEQPLSIDKTGEKVNNHGGNDIDVEEEENEAFFGETEISSMRVNRRVLHDSDTEEEEMTFDGTTEASEVNHTSTLLIHEADHFKCNSVEEKEELDSENKLDSQSYTINGEEKKSGIMESDKNCPVEVEEQAQCTSAAGPSSEHNALIDDELMNRDTIDHENDNSKQMSSSTTVEINEDAIKARMEENYTQSSMIVQDVILEDSEALVLDGTQNSFSYGVNNSVESFFLLAQTQSQSETIMFSSEEVPTQLPSQLEAENCFTPPAVGRTNLNNNNTVEETPTQLMDSQEEMIVDPELMEGQPNGESPTQILNSQFYATENY